MVFILISDNYSKLCSYVFVFYFIFNNNLYHNVLLFVVLEFNNIWFSVRDLQQGVCQKKVCKVSNINKLLIWIILYYRL